MNIFLNFSFVEINPGLLKVKVSEHSIVTTDLPEVRYAPVNESVNFFKVELFLGSHRIHKFAHNDLIYGNQILFYSCYLLERFYQRVC